MRKALPCILALITLGPFVACKNDSAGSSAVNTNPRSRSPEAEINARVDTMLRKGDWRTALDQLNGGERFSAFSDLVKSGRVSLELLARYAGTDSAMLQEVGHAAGKAGDMAVLRVFGDLNPGDQRERALKYFVEALTRGGDMREAIGILNEFKLYPAELMILAESFSAAIWQMGPEEARVAAETPNMPESIRFQVGICYGQCIGEMLPGEGLPLVVSLPEDIREMSLRGYWEMAATKHLDLAEEAWNRGEIPLPIQKNVGNMIVVGIAKERSREEAAQFTTTVADPKVAHWLADTVYYGWMDVDPAAAQESAARLPEGEAKKQALLTIAERLKRN